MTAKEYLRQLWHLDRRINIRLQELEAEAFVDYINSLGLTDAEGQRPDAERSAGGQLL